MNLSSLYIVEGCIGNTFTSTGELARLPSLLPCDPCRLHTAGRPDGWVALWPGAALGASLAGQLDDRSAPKGLQTDASPTACHAE